MVFIYYGFWVEKVKLMDNVPCKYNKVNEALCTKRINYMYSF